MARKALPFYKMYPADAESDENFRSMNDTELGFYWRCLNHAWINGGIPGEREEIARVFRVSTDYLDAVWPRVSRCFAISDSGRLVNKRQEIERDEAKAKSAKATDSIRKRYERNTNVDESYEVRRSNVGIRASESDSDSKNSEELENSPKPASAREVLDSAKKVCAITSSPQYTMDESYQDVIVVARQFWPDSLDEDFIEAHRAWRILSWEQKAFALENLRGKQEREPGAGQFVKKNFAAYMASAEWKRRPREPTANSRNQVREVPVCEYPPVPTFRKPHEEYATTD